MLHCDIATAGDARAESRHAFLQRSGTGHLFERAARRVDLGDGVVHERFVRVVQELKIRLLVDRVRERIVVVCRQRYHRQHFARVDVHDDRGGVT